MLCCTRSDKPTRSFKARFIGIDGEPSRVMNTKDKDGKEQFISNALPDEKSMREVVDALETAKWSLVSVQSREQQRRPLAPFITSQLQRDASSKLGFNVRRTMGVAQRLYEGIDLGAEGTTGLITYMRTDSPRVSPEAIEGCARVDRKAVGRAVSACDHRMCTRARRTRRMRTKRFGQPMLRAPRNQLRAI